MRVLQSTADMPTILETASQMPKDWNPMTRNWLPSEMTSALPSMRQAQWPHLES